MEPYDHNPFAADHRSLEAVCGTMLLGRLGSEIAKLYDDSLAAPLPERLRRLIEQLEMLEGRRDR